MTWLIIIAGWIAIAAIFAVPAGRFCGLNEDREDAIEEMRNEAERAL